MTIKSKVDEILCDDNSKENQKFDSLCKLARDLEDEVAKLKMENKELHEILSFANRQTDAAHAAAYNCGFSGIVPRMFPTFGR